jgi:hypothetical protein
LKISANSLKKSLQIQRKELSLHQKQRQQLKHNNMKQTNTLPSKYQIRWAIIMINQKRVFKYQERELHKLGFSVCSNYPGEAFYACKHYRDSERLNADAEAIKMAATICKSNEGALDYTAAQYGSCGMSVRPMDNATTLQISKFNALISQ